MRKIQIIDGRVCPKCGHKVNQIYKGLNKSSTKKCLCKDCGCMYTENPKTRAYPEEKRKEALRLLVSGMSSRQIGILLDMNKANAHNWAKKNRCNVHKSADQI